jgi:hypothetical protein
MPQIPFGNGFLRVLAGLAQLRKKHGLIAVDVAFNFEGLVRMVKRSFNTLYGRIISQ